MDKRLILAVAGSGKTTYLINHLDLEQKFLLVTYTENNLLHLKQSVVRKFGYIPDNITIKSYFQFLVQDCYRPFLKDVVRDNGINWNTPSEETLRLSRNNLCFYLSKGRLLYHNRIAKLCQQFGCVPKVKARLEKFYDCLMLDEVQDLGGHDFDLVQKIIPDIDCLFVGDYYQHTFDTSRDGNLNRGLYENIKKYKKKWKDVGINIDEKSLSNSYRCSPDVCAFVSSYMKIPIASNREECTQIIHITSQVEADTLFADDTIVKLFYEDGNKYRCYAENWGKSKGLDHFNDICVVLTDTAYKAFQKGDLSTLSPSTLNKLYVAITRAHGDLYFLSRKLYKCYKGIK